MLKEEHNSRIHLFFTAIVVAFMLIFRFTLVEYALLVLAIGLVFMAELFNSALENLSDHISPDRHVNIKKVKDLSAAAVLVSALAAFAIGCLILGPKLINIWEFIRKI